MTEPEIFVPSADASAAVPAERSERGSPIWTAALAAEIALADRPVQEVCGRYGIDRDSWERIRQDKAFQAAVSKCCEMLAGTGRVSG